MSAGAAVLRSDLQVPQEVPQLSLWGGGGGTLFWGPYNKDPTMKGTLSRVPLFSDFGSTPGSPHLDPFCAPNLGYCPHTVTLEVLFIRWIYRRPLIVALL